METIKVFCTSGWDSTYRLVELSRMEVVVQPIYITEMGRLSEEKEKAALDKIFEALKAKSETKAEFLPIRYVKQKDIPANEEISKAFHQIRREIGLGEQYEFLSLYVAVCPGVEIGCEGGEPTKLRMTRALMMHGGGKVENGNFVIEKSQSDEVGRLVFDNIAFPIINTTELEMRKNILEWGYQEVMSNIWFCHRPIHDEPCGLCRACEVKMQSGLEYLLPKKGQHRYHVKQTLMAVFGKHIGSGLSMRIFFR